MKHFITTSLFIATALTTLAQEKINISGNDWHFLYAKDAKTAEAVAQKGFGQLSFDDSTFDKISVPSNWAVLGYEEPVYRGFPNDEASEGFYIKRFNLPKYFRGKRVLLHFGGVWNSAEVWLNGHRLGLHESGYTSFSYNVSDFIKGDSVNTLAVRVRQVYPGYKTDTYDDWTLGGIYRDVTLEAMPRKQWIDNVRVLTSFNNDYSEADVTVRTIVVNTTKNTLPGNYQSPGRDYVLRISLTDTKGQVAAQKDVTVKGHVSTSRDTKTVLHLKNPMKWTAETPNLYKLSVALLGADGKPTQTHTEKIGVREISTKDGVLRINGQPVKLRGVNRHDEHPDVGRAVGHQHWLQDLQLMKSANINYVRACHYQHAKGFIEMCDSIGMYVGAEVSLGGASQMMYDPAFISAVMLRTQETVERDLNNPSVIYWSVGNEDPFTYMHLRAIRTVKGIDPTRPVLMPWNASELLPEEIDILAPHYWTSYEYDSLCATSKRPVITTEYVHAYGEMRFGGLEDCFRALHKHPAGAGGAVWMWADQGIKTPTKRDEKVYGSIVKDNPYLRVSSAGWDGITDSYRRPTRDFYETKAVYAPVYPDVETATLPKGAKSVNIPIRNDYDFIGIDDVKIAYRVFVDDRETDRGEGSVSAQPHHTAPFSISTKGVGELTEGQTCYVQFTFSRGSEQLSQRAVELKPAYAKTLTTQQADPQVGGSENDITITCGDLTYTFDRNTGLLASLTHEGKKAIDAMRPTIWHALNEGDQIIKNRSFAKGTDPERPSVRVTSMKVNQEKGKVMIVSEVEYSVDSLNSFTAKYTNTIDCEGRLTVDYTISPQVVMNYLPVVGMAVKTASPDDVKRWLGLGPCDTYPNKKAAGLLGVWDAKDMTGTHQARWVDIETAKGTKTRITVNGYIDRDKTTSKELRLLSQVLGRAEKGRLNDVNYRVTPDQTFTGKVIVCPM